MIALTSNAAVAVRGLMDRPGLATGTGLRIAANAERSGLRLSFAAAPAENDTVVESRGIPLFLDQDAAQALDGKVLDAETDTAGQVQIIITDQTR